jgi:molecular chaperone DnaK (HSP70)
VPVDFNARQRDATVAAFRSAGLHVSRVLEEPTAAAIAYGLHQDPAVHFIVVFDFGGGTLDVSLLFVRAGSIRVVDTLGDNNLGGEDVDALVAEFLSREFASQLGIDKIPSVASDIEQGEEDGDDGESPASIPPCTQSGVRRAAESLKRALSSAISVTASCVSSETFDGATNTKVSVVMTREQLEALCEPLLERTMAPVRTILTENHMDPDEIDAVVLVGGSSRIPWVRERLTELFGGQPPLTDIDPDVAVAYGAARTLD